MTSWAARELMREMVHGAVSFEHRDGLTPWRLPFERRGLFPSPNDGLLTQARMASGVRLVLSTTSPKLRLRVGRLPPVDAVMSPRRSFFFDAVVDGELVASQALAPGKEEVVFEELGAGERIVEIWLPADAAVTLRGLDVAAGSACHAAPSRGRRWATYGSSLTHCRRAHSPARTWPALVARRQRLDLLCLGFAGQCHLDPMVSRVMRDLPADFISLELGINCIHGSLGPRTFPAAVIGFIETLRDGHPETPIALVSPLCCPPWETKLNPVGYSLSAMRRDMRAVHAQLVAAGDRWLTYVDGAELFGADLIARYAPDECHPDGDGIELLAERFEEQVMRPLMAHTSS